jgi:hypothetical protein
MRALVVLVAMIAALGGLTGVVHDAMAAGQVYGPFDDGCYYSWDGYSAGYTGRFCPVSDPSRDIYLQYESRWMIFTWDVWTANAGQWQYVARYLNNYGTATWFFPDGSKLEQAGNGLEIYTYPDGTSTSNMNDTQLAALAIVERAENAAIDTILAPECTYSYNGC